MSIPQISVATYLANESTYNAEPFDILDTATNITNALGTLNGVSTLQQIIVSNNASLSINAGQVTNDATALGKLIDANGNSASLTVTDTNTAIFSNFTAIAANSDITSIVVSNNTIVQISVADLINDASTLSVITNANSTPATFNVQDSAAQIGLHFASIGADSQVTTITISNSQTVTITAAQAALNNTAVQDLANLGGGTVHVTVKDTAANISANLPGIVTAGSHVTSIVVSNSQPLSLTGAEIANDSATLALVTNNNGGTVSYNVVDTSTDFATYLSQIDAINSKIGTVSFTDTNPAVTVSQSVFTSDSSLLSKINTDFAFTITGVTVAGVSGVTSTAEGMSNSADFMPLSIQVADTGANIGPAFDTLNSNTAITKIVITSGNVTIGAASAANDTTALGELYLSNGATHATVSVLDSAANVQSNLNGLETNVSHISGITLSSGTQITTSFTNFSADTGALALISTSFNLGVTGATIAQAHSIAGTLTTDSINATLNSLTISDSASNVTTDFAGNQYLEGFYTSGDLATGAITLTDTGTPTITVAYGNYTTTAQDTLDDIGSTFDLAVTGVSVANLGTVLGTSITNAAAISVTVSDTATNIESGLSTLVSDNSSISSITSTTTEPAFTLTETAFSADSTLLSKITNGYTAALTAVLAVDAGTLAGNSHVTGITVSDSPANAVTYWSSLETAYADGKLTEVSIGSGVTITIPSTDIFSGGTSTFSTNGQGVFNALNTLGFTVDFTGLTVAQTGQLATLLSGNASAALGTITVSDTAANVQTDLSLGGSSVLESYKSDMSAGSITLTDSGTPTITLTYGNFTVNAESVLNDIGTSFDLAITGVTVGQLSTTAGATITNAAAISVTVVDSAANIESNASSAGLDQLETYASHITSITSNSGAITFQLTDTGGTPAWTVYTAAESVLSKVAGSFTVDVGGVLAADAATVNTSVEGVTLLNGASLTLSIAVVDSAADVASSASSLTSANHVTSVTVSDTASDVSTYLDQLNGVSNLTVTFTDGGTPTLYTSESVFVGGLNTLAAVSNASWDLAVTGVTVAQRTTVESDVSGLANHANISLDVQISDTAANVAGAVSALNGDSKVGYIEVNDSTANVATYLDTLNGITGDMQIFFTGSGTQTLSLTYAQLSGGLNALADVYPSFTLDVSTNAPQAATAASDVAGLSNHANITLHIAVSDTAMHVANNAAALDNASNHVSSVSVTDTAANIVTYLNTLNTITPTLSIDISPAGSLKVTYAQLSDSVALGAVSDPGQISVVAVTVAELSSVQSTVHSDNAGFTVSAIGIADTAANIEANLDTLGGNSLVHQIVITDNNPINLTLSELYTNPSTPIPAAQTAIALLANANSTPAVVNVSDTAADIPQYMDDLNTLSHITNIIISDSNPLTLTAEEAGNDLTAVGKLENQNSSGVVINVVDTGANISTYLNGLQSDADIATITVSNNAAITVSVATLNADSVVLSEIQNANSSQVQLTVSDTAANIVGNLAEISEDITGGSPPVTHVVISDNNPLMLTVQQIVNYGNVLNTGVLSDQSGSPYVLDVSDNSGNISSHFATLASTSNLGTITITNDGSISLTYAELSGDTSTLAKLLNANSSTVTFTVDDTAANISNNFAAIAGNSQVTALVISDNNPLSLNASEVGNDATLLSNLSNNNATTPAIDVTDTAANIAAYLNALNANADVASIVVSPSGGTMTITETQLNGDTTALGLLNTSNAGSNVYSITVTGATVSSFAADLSQPHVTSVSITDSMANVAANLTGSDSLETNASKITSITLTDGTTPTLTLTQTQFNADTAILAKIGGTWNLDITGATVAGFAADAANAHVGTGAISISDTSANVQADLTGGDTAGLETNAGKIASITFSDGSPALTITEAEYKTDTAVLGKIVTNYALNLTTVAAADVAGLVTTLGSASHVSSFTLAVQDTAANIEANFDALNSSHVTAIVNTSNGNLVLSAEQALNDGHALSVLTNQNSSSFTVSVSDTAAHISNNFAALNTDAANLTSIVISNNAALALTVAELSDTAALAITVDKNATPIAINVTDTASDISAGLNAIEGNNNVDSVTISDNGTVTVASIAQLNADASVIADLANANGQAVHVTVTDTAANIQTNLAELNQNTKITSIVISDNNPLSVNMATVENDTRALGELHNQNSSAVDVMVSDTAANIQGGLNALESLVAVLGTVTDTNNAAISISAVQATSDYAALNDIIYKNGGTAIFNVSDTAANIQSNLTDLGSLANSGHIGTVTVTDGGTITATYTEFTGSDAFLGSAKGAHTLDITGVTGQSIDNESYGSFSRVVNSGNQITNETFYAGSNLSGTVVTDLNIAYNQSAYGLTGVTVDTYTQVPGESYIERMDVYSSGTEVLRVTEAPSGALTYTSSAAGLTLSGTASTASSFTVTGFNDTFNFEAGAFGTNTVTGYANPDIINFNGSFANVSAVESHEAQVGNNVVITYDAHDTITFTNTTISAFNSTSGDWHFGT